MANAAAAVASANPLTGFLGSMGAGLGKGIGDAIGGGGPMTSGGQVTDAKGYFDGSGWTVATGGSNARGGSSGGGKLDGLKTDAPKLNQPGGVMQAGLNGVLMLMLGGAALWFIAKH